MKRPPIITRDGLRIRAHRAAWLDRGWPLRPNERLFRTCDQTDCIDPEHYRKAEGTKPRTRNPAPRTGKPNAWQRRLLVMYCPQSHRYTAENTYTYPTGHGDGFYRKCVTCTNERTKARRAERTEP